MTEREDDVILVRLTQDEALILSDWIYRLQRDREMRDRCVDDKAVWLPLYRLSGTLETTLPEIFAADYAGKVASARARLLTKLGDVES